MKHGFSTRTRLAWLAIVILMLLVLPLAACGGAGGGSTIPINLTGASDVESLHIELVYDPAIIEVTAIKAGKLAQSNKGVNVSPNISTPGRAIIGVICAAGINGTGSVADVSFKAKVKTGTSALTLENVAANRYVEIKLQDIKTTVSAGQYNAQSKKVTAPSIAFQ